MKILVFCSNSVNGGTARIFYEMVTTMRRLAAPEDKVAACVNENNPVEIYRRIEGMERLPVYSEEEICSGMYGGTLLKRIVNRVLRKIKYRSTKRRNIAVMQKYLRQNKFDAVIIHNGGYVGDDLCNQMLTAAYRCVEHTLCRTYVLHSDAEKNICSKLRFSLYDKKISKEATQIVTVSEFTKNRMQWSSFISRDIQVIHNGISETHTLPEEEKHKIVHVDSKDFNILMIGNFLDNKGQHKFIEAAGELHRKSDRYRFTIIGNVYDEVYFKECKNLIKKLGLTEKISIYHGIHNAAEFISLFDVLAVPSMYDESFGLISVEAMANGRTVVAFACGGIPEVVVDGRNGFVVPVGDARRMAEKIEWLAEHEEERKMMGERNRRDYEERFSAEAMTLRYMKAVGMKHL